MRITTTVELEAGDSFLYTPDAGAMQVLVALGGNASNDYSVLNVRQDQSGEAGTNPTPPGPMVE